MAASSSQQAEKIMNVHVDYVKYANFNHNNPFASTSSTHAPRRNPINNIELAVDTFIGRVTELNDIMQLFHQYPVVVVAGMGGMGKTQLARKFASVNADVYRDRYWINAETEEQLLRSFDRLARKVKVDANTDIDTVRDTYRSFNDGAALLIFDNVEHVKNVYKYLPTRIQLEDITLHVLITSRYTEWTSDSSVNYYPLQSLGISASLQLFQRKFSKTCIETMQDKWEELARLLGYLPLALQVATSYIYKRSKHNSNLPIVLADYIKQLKEGADGLLNDPLTEYDNRSVYASMLLTLKQLENKTDNKWKLAVTLINAAAYVNPDWIEKKSLLKLLDNHDNPCILDEALVILTEFSLFNQAYAHYTVHRIIQTSIRHDQTAKGTADTYYTGALKYTLADNNIHWHVLQYANERVTVVVNYYKENPSPILLKHLVQYKVIRAVLGVFNRMTRNQVQALIQQQDLLYYAVRSGDLCMAQLLYHNGADINQPCRVKDGSPLHLALRRRNMEIATWLLDNGAAPTQRDLLGRNALHVASKYANHKMVSIIIKTDRATINETDNSGQTPLHVIGYFHNEEDILPTIRVLVECGVDLTAVDIRGNTVLHSAAKGACVAAVSLILQLNKDLIDIVNEDGETALHVIPYIFPYKDEHILSTIRVLVECDVDLTKVDIRGNTVLHSAARDACAAAVSLILQLNKDLINIVNKDDETALHVIPYSFSSKDEHILSTIRVLVECEMDLTKVDIRGNTVLHSAARGTCAAAVSLILQLNKDLINIVNKNGETALHLISYANAYINDERILSAIRALVECGVDLTKVDIRGNTVLHSAARGTCAAAVSLILQLNKDLINIVNEDGETALHVIPYSLRFEEDEHIFSAIRALVECGVDLTKVDIRGNTVLHSVALSACAAAVSLILQRNKDLINIANEDGETALHVIPYSSPYIEDERILSTIRVLVESGVDLLKVDRRGNTTLHAAADGARAAAASLFHQLNKDLMNIVNDEGQTALHVLGNDINEFDEDEIEPFTETARVLIMNGLSLDAKDKTGRTLLDAVWNTKLKDILRQMADECNNQFGAIE